MQYCDKGVFCVSWKGNRLENHLLERCAFGEVFTVVLWNLLCV